MGRMTDMERRRVVVAHKQQVRLTESLPLLHAGLLSAAEPPAAGLRSRPMPRSQCAALACARWHAIQARTLKTEHRVPAGERPSIGANPAELGQIYGVGIGCARAALNSAC